MRGGAWACSQLLAAAERLCRCEGWGVECVQGGGACVTCPTHVPHSVLGLWSHSEGRGAIGLKRPAGLLSLTFGCQRAAFRSDVLVLVCNWCNM